MEEKRWLIGRKTLLSKDTVWESSKGTSVSKTAITDSDKTELLKNWPAGLTGADIASCTIFSINYL